MTDDVSESRRIVDGVVERFSDPDRARVTFRMAARLDDGLRMDVDIRRHRIVVDEPASFGGTDAGPNPVELLLAALMTCQAITYRVWAARLGVALAAVRVEAEGDIDLRGFLGIDEVRSGFSAVRLHVALEGPDAPERYRALADAVDAHCPVLDVMGTPVPVERVVAPPAG